MPRVWVPKGGGGEGFHSNNCSSVSQRWSERPVRLKAAWARTSPAGRVTGAAGFRTGAGGGTRSNERRLGRRRRMVDGRTDGLNAWVNRRTDGPQSNSGGGKRGGGVFGENIRGSGSGGGGGWFAYILSVIYIAAKPNNLGGAAAEQPPSLGVLGVNSSSSPATHSMFYKRQLKLAICSMIVKFKGQACGEFHGRPL